MLVLVQIDHELKLEEFIKKEDILKSLITELNPKKWRYICNTTENAWINTCCFYLEIKWYQFKKLIEILHGFKQCFKYIKVNTINKHIEL